MASNRLPAAQKRAVENAWAHMLDTCTDDGDQARLQDMLKRVKRTHSKDHGLAAMCHAAYLGDVNRMDWYDAVPVVEACLFGARYCRDLDSAVMLAAAQVHDAELGASSPADDTDPAPASLAGMDLL